MRGSIVLVIVGIIAIIFWHKKINPDTTWIYAMYVISVILMTTIILIGN